MSWIQPKTDWTPLDYINYSDYNRIVNNLRVIHDLSAEVLGINYSIGTMTDASGYVDIPYADLYNIIEDNLDIINLRTYSFNVGEKKTFYPNQAYIDYAELNRIESATKKIYETLVAQEELKRKLPTVVGRNRILNVVRE